MAKATYETASRSKPGTHYDIGFEADGTLTCTCKGYYYRQTCYHVDQARQLVADEMAALPGCTFRDIRARLLALLVETEQPMDMARMERAMYGES